MTTADTYSRAAMLYQERSFDCVTLDLGLGELPGVHFLRLLATTDRQIPVIVVSGLDADALDEAVSLGKSLGVDVRAVMRKPIDPTALRVGLECLKSDLRGPRMSVSGSAAAGTASAAHLLIVEDAVLERTLIARIAEKLGFGAAGAGSYAQAAMLLQERKFDCIAVDLGLGAHRGEEILQLLAAIPDNRIPLVIVSGAEQAACDAVKVAQSLGLNVCATLRKPSTSRKCIPSSNGSCGRPLPGRAAPGRKPALFTHSGAGLHMQKPFANRHGRPPIALAVTAILIATIVGANVAFLVDLRRTTLQSTETDLGRFSLTLAEQTDRSFKSLDLVLSSVGDYISRKGVNDTNSFRQLIGLRHVPLPQGEDHGIAPRRRGHDDQLGGRVHQFLAVLADTGHELR